MGTTCSRHGNPDWDCPQCDQIDVASKRDKRDFNRRVQWKKILHFYFQVGASESLRDLIPENLEQILTGHSRVSRRKIMHLYRRMLNKTVNRSPDYWRFQLTCNPDGRHPSVADVRMSSPTPFQRLEILASAAREKLEIARLLGTLPPFDYRKEFSKFSHYVESEGDVVCHGMSLISFISHHQVASIDLREPYMLLLIAKQVNRSRKALDEFSHIFKNLRTVQYFQQGLFRPEHSVVLASAPPSAPPSAPACPSRYEGDRVKKVLLEQDACFKEAFFCGNPDIGVSGNAIYCSRCSTPMLNISDGCRLCRGYTPSPTSDTTIPDVPAVTAVVCCDIDDSPTCICKFSAVNTSTDPNCRVHHPAPTATCEPN